MSAAGLGAWPLNHEAITTLGGLSPGARSHPIEWLHIPSCGRMLFGRGDLWVKDLVEDRAFDAKPNVNQSLIEIIEWNV